MLPGRGRPVARLLVNSAVTMIKLSTVAAVKAKKTATSKDAVTTLDRTI
jgi:hypothetical protein